MHPNIEQSKSKFAKVHEHLKAELNGVRSGRATPALVEHIKVEAYGATTPLIELASINSPEPRLLVIQPWDKSIIKEVEKALQAANLGLNPVVDGVLLRLNFPALSEERRKELVKLLGTKLEDAKVSARNVREEVLKEFKELKNNGEVTEDEFFVAQKELQKLVDDCNAKIKQMGDDKEKEIMTI